MRKKKAHELEKNLKKKKRHKKTVNELEKGLRKKTSAGLKSV